jgi:hypothetical protein
MEARYLGWRLWRPLPPQVRRRRPGPWPENLLGAVRGILWWSQSRNTHGRTLLAESVESTQHEIDVAARIVQDGNPVPVGRPAVP